MLVQSCHNRNHLQAEAVKNSNPAGQDNSSIGRSISVRDFSSGPSANQNPNYEAQAIESDSANNNSNSANLRNSLSSLSISSSCSALSGNTNTNASSPSNDILLADNPIVSEFDLVADIPVINNPSTPVSNLVKEVPLSIPLSQSQYPLISNRQPIPGSSKSVRPALPLPLPHSQSGLQLGATSFLHSLSSSNSSKMSDAYLSGIKPDMLKNNNNNMRQGPMSAPNTPEAMRKQQLQLLRSRVDPMSSSLHASAKKEKMEFNQMMMKMSEREGRPLSYHGRSTAGHDQRELGVTVNKRHVGSSSSVRSRKESTLLNRRSIPGPYLENRYREKFDVSDLDTNLPRIDLEAIENHLRLAREEERKRRSDREEIRRRLALESEDLNDKPMGRKPSLHSRLQSSMNLQICFMNETASDSESPNSDSEAKNQQPASLPCVKAQSGSGNDVNGSSGPTEDFYTKQARLQAEARQALSQAKEMARLQMAQEKESRLTSPITDMVRNSLCKVGVNLPPERRRVSRQLLTEMNVAQLQVIVNDLHTHIEVLNETLVSMLLERDDLHMEQDSMLVDIEDLTRYLAAKDNSPHQSLPLISASRSLLGKK